MGVPRGCMVVLYLGCGVEFVVMGGGWGGGWGGDGGGDVWYVFNEKTVVICKVPF